MPVITRKLSQQEINLLKTQACKATDWSQIQVVPQFSTERIYQVSFSGPIVLGSFKEDFVLPGGVVKQSGIRNACLHNCIIGDNVLIENIQNYIANYQIGKNSIIQNIDVLCVDGLSTFGNGTPVAVLAESGGREVLINDKLSAHFAYIVSLYRHRPELIRRLHKMVRFYAKKHSSTVGVVGKQVKIINTGSIKNVYVGDYAEINGACRLENGSINSNSFAPVSVGHSVIAKDFILSSGAKVEGGATLNRCFVGQACTLDHNYSASDSLFFSNCLGENGEACAVFAGPYTVTHHKSTLLIAGMFSFMNAGSGSNQSNHMYKLGPIHQGIIERGGKTTSDSFILWPAKIGAFSLIMGRHYGHSDTSNLPFSYLIESDDSSVMVPGANLRSVGTIRDAQKFPKRDARKDPHKLDQINFNLLSPYTVHKMFNAVDVLQHLRDTCGETSEFYTYQSCKIKNNSLYKGLYLYQTAIHKFLGNSIISRLKHCPCTTDQQVRDFLQPDTEVGVGEWIDLAGLLAPKSEIDQLLCGIEKGAITRLQQINEVFANLHQQYYSLEWTWAYQKIEQFYRLDRSSITRQQIIVVVQAWKKAVVDLDKLLYEDAKKEFSLSSRTSFGADGSRAEQKLDFEEVRGDFEKNTFVQAVLQHIEEKTQLGDELIARLS